MLKTIFYALAILLNVITCDGQCYSELANRFCLYKKREELKIGSLLRIRTTHDFYGYGNKWKEGPCVDCSCDAHNYTELFTCYLKAEPGMEVDPDPPVYTITLAPHQFYFGFCPYKMDLKRTKAVNVPVQFYLKYRKVAKLMKSCCNNAEKVTDLPDDCKAVPIDKCRFDYVKKYNETMPCNGTVSVVG